jgi:predicted dehydrogenase
MTATTLSAPDDRTEIGHHRYPRRAMAAPRIGLVGCGRWGGNILRDLRQLGAAVLVADPDPASRQAADRAGAAVTVADAADLGVVDALIVATPATRHAEDIRSLLDRQVPIAVEKPFTTDPDVAEQLAASAGTGLFVLDKWRYHEGIERLAALAQGGDLGAVHSVQTIRVQPSHAHPDVDAVWTLAPHDLSIAHEILGHDLPPVRAAVAERSATTTGWLDGIHGVLGDPADAGSVPSVLVSVSARHAFTRREIRVDGGGVRGQEEGGGGAAVLVRAADGGLTEVPIGASMPLRRQLGAFLDHLRGVGPPLRGTAAAGATVVRRISELRAAAGTT